MALIYLDLDGTVANFDGWKGFDHIGDPIPTMADKIRTWLARGDEVVIFTARACDFNVHGDAKFDLDAIVSTVQDWTEKHFGVRLKVTATKGPWDACYDDAINQVVRNTGKTLQECVLEQIDELRRCYGSSEAREILTDLELFVRTFGFAKKS